uniref:E3 ubiquitin-protein ligase n=1 Tax=Bactrocera dorsalis TaxID=27457 RepID=A0A034VU06_BACDO
MEQSEELNGSLEHGGNVIASVPRVMTMRDEANAAVIVPFEVEPNSQLPTTSVAATSSASITTTTMGENVTAADAVIDLCNSSPTPSTSKTAAAAAAASIINVDSSPEEQSPNDEDVAGPSAAIECPICLQACIHPARLPCGHIFCFLCVKGVAYKNRRCAMCRREIPPEFLDHPDLVNGIDDICATKSTEDGYQWFYEGRNGGWWAYDPRSSNDIEDAYQTRMLGTSLIDLEEDCRHEVLICGAIYTIDFGDMVQHPVQNPSRKRKICRSKHMPTKGVAGILKN